MDILEVFVARQPIFDKNMQVIAYELLFRKNSANNVYDLEDGDSATLQLILNSFSVIGLDNLTNGKKAFINFTENLIKKEMTTLLPKDLVVIEILEDVEPSEEVISACKALKDMGYTLALDDYILKYGDNPLLSLVDIVKVDFLYSSLEERKEIYKTIKEKYDVKLLAEKVETKEEFNTAIEIGYDYFQGYFFSKPNIVSGYDFPHYSVTSFKLLDEINKEEINFDNIENIIKTDVSIAYKLLRFINSAKFSLKQEVTSIKQAVLLLGRNELLKWIFLVSLSNIAEGCNSELMTTSIIRGKFCENISTKINKRFQSAAFMVGSLSMLDAIINMDIKEIVKELPVQQGIKDALVSRDNILGKILGVVVGYEKEDLNLVEKLLKELGLEKENISYIYLDAVAWSNKFIEV